MKTAAIIILLLFLVGLTAYKLEAFPQDFKLQNEGNFIEYTKNDTSNIQENSQSQSIKIETQGNSTSTSQSSVVVLENGKLTESQIIKLELTISENTISASSIELQSDNTVVFSITNQGGEHTFVIPKLGVDTGLLPLNQSVEVHIPTDKPGEYEYYSSMGNDKENGIKGKLIIKD